MPAPGARLGSGVHGEKPKWVASIDLPLTVASADDEVAPMNGFGVPKERFGEGAAADRRPRGKTGRVPPAEHPTRQLLGCGRDTPLPQVPQTCFTQTAQIVEMVEHQCATAPSGSSRWRT